jgi:hypothetical protein
MGNRQAFFNKENDIMVNDEKINPEHALFDYRDGLNWTVLYLFAIPIAIFFRFFVNLCKKCLRLIRGNTPDNTCWREHFDDDWQFTEIIDE